ncbi:MAG: AAA family ATPase [Acidimicrobiia bacterium]|nr:AAA family ATPase [Acidimicrobiia bacterium]
MAGNRSASRDSGSLEQLLAAKEILVVCGPGGVGKTTIAAAAAMMASTQFGGRVLVLTVDPARRLASALGIGQLGNTEIRVPDAAFEAAGLEPRGELWAAMLDMKASWDDLVSDHAPDSDVRDAILTNPLYQNVTGKFVQSHDYIAMERLHEIHSSGRYDLIVVDTPPSRNAIDFLEAPGRMADFFSSRLLRWLTVPYRSRLVSAASRPFYTVADRLLGSQFLRDISEFFGLFQTMHEGFVERARAVERTLADRRTTFAVVSTLEAASVDEAEYFIEALAERRLHLGALMLNRVLPAGFRDRRGATAARRMIRDAEALADQLPLDAPAPDVAAVLTEIGESYLNYRLPASREAELREELEVAADVVVSIPFFDADIHDLEGLRRVGERLWDV